MEWTNTEVQAHYLQEVTARFEKENVEWWTQPGENEHSFLWELFGGCEITFHLNSVTIAFPKGFSVSIATLKMFDDTEVAWSSPCVEVENGMLTAYVLLVDSWDDERSAAYKNR